MDSILKKYPVKLLNICFLNTVQFWGGGEKTHLEHAVYLSKKGHNVQMFCAKGSELYNRSKQEGLAVKSITIGNLSFLNPFKTYRLYKMLKNSQIDTVIFSSSKDAKLGGIASKRAGIRRIVYMRGLATPIKGSMINKFLFKRLVTHIVANSEETKRTVLKNLSEVLTPDRIKVIYRGFDFNLLDQKSQEKLDIDLPSDLVVLGNAGRLTAQKGQHYLLEVAKKLKETGLNFMLLIAGTGELKESLEEKIKIYKLEHNVRLLGFVENIQAFMNAIDIFVLPSIWEGFGQVLAEAMYQSKPIVAFNITSNPEVVVDQHTGFLVDYPDVEALYDKVKTLMEDAELRKNMGQAGKQRVLEQFKLEDKIEEFEQFLQQTS